jgi:hypothetical protein
MAEEAEEGKMEAEVLAAAVVRPIPAPVEIVDAAAEEDAVGAAIDPRASRVHHPDIS